MYNIFRKHRRWRLISAILSLSLLTVMGGAVILLIIATTASEKN